MALWPVWMEDVNACLSNRTVFDPSMSNNVYISFYLSLTKNLTLSKLFYLPKHNTVTKVVNIVIFVFNVGKAARLSNEPQVWFKFTLRL